MNLRRTLLAGALSLGLLGSIAAPAAMASPPSESDGSNNSVTVEVEVVGGGGFDAFFCTPSGSHANWTGTLQTTNAMTQDMAPTAGSDGHAAGALVICYDDTLTYRPNFDVQIASGAFTSGNAVVSTPIDASNFLITRTHNVAQNQWGWNGAIDIGDIGSFGQNGYLAQNTLPTDWTNDSLRSLDQSRLVQFGYYGQGTIFSWGLIETELNIPAGTAPGTYASTVTLTIIPGTQ